MWSPYYGALLVEPPTRESTTGAPYWGPRAREDEDDEEGQEEDAEEEEEEEEEVSRTL